MSAKQRTIDVILDGYGFFEAPRWCDGRLWLCDFYTYKVYAVAPEGQVEVIAEVAGGPNGLGWLPDGRMLVGSMKDQLVLRREPDGSLAIHANFAKLAPWLITELVTDAQGRAFVGNAGFDLVAGKRVIPAFLTRVDPDGTTTVVAENLLVPNNMLITPDQSTLILSETAGQRLTAFNIETDGSLSRRREWARFGEVSTLDDMAAVFGNATLCPDGISLDAEGAIWAADAAHARAVRVREGGEIIDEITTGDLGVGVFACELGGADGSTLYLCAAPSFVEKEARAKLRGKLLSCRVDVPSAAQG